MTEYRPTLHPTVVVGLGAVATRAAAEARRRDAVVLGRVPPFHAFLTVEAADGWFVVTLRVGEDVEVARSEVPPTAAALTRSIDRALAAVTDLNTNFENSTFSGCRNHYQRSSSL